MAAKKKIEGTEMFRLVNGEKVDEDLHEAILGNDESPDDWVVPGDEIETLPPEVNESDEE